MGRVRIRVRVRVRVRVRARVRVSHRTLPRVPLSLGTMYGVCISPG